MIPRRVVLGAALAASAPHGLSEASAQPYGADGLDRRTLEDVERAWIKSRYYVDLAMEEGRLSSRSNWSRSKAMIVCGTFNLGYLETGKAERIENGVRTGKIA